MARTRHESDIEDAYRVVADVLEAAVRETLATPGPDPARSAVGRLTAVDDELPEETTPPGWSLAFLVLADWYDVAREQLTDPEDAAERALGWVRTHLGGRFAARARYTVTPLVAPDRAQEASLYVDALGEDFLPTMVWTVAGLVAEFPDTSDAGAVWPRTLAEARL